MTVKRERLELSGRGRSLGRPNRKLLPIRWTSSANTYQHVIPELKRDAAERVGELLFEEPEELAVKTAVKPDAE